MSAIVTQIVIPLLFLFWSCLNAYFQNTSFVIISAFILILLSSIVIYISLVNEYNNIYKDKQLTNATKHGKAFKKMLTIIIKSWILIFIGTIVLHNVLPSISVPFTNTFGYMYIRFKMKDIVENIIIDNTTTKNTDTNKTMLFKIYNDISYFVNLFNTTNVTNILLSLNTHNILVPIDMYKSRMNIVQPTFTFDDMIAHINEIIQPIVQSKEFVGRFVLYVLSGIIAIISINTQITIHIISESLSVNK